MPDYVSIIRDYINAWECRDVERINSFYGPNVVYQDMRFYNKDSGGSVMAAASTDNLPTQYDNKVVGLEAMSRLNEEWVRKGADEAIWHSRYIGEIAPGVVVSERVDELHYADGRVRKVPIVGIFEFGADGKIIGQRDYATIPLGVYVEGPKKSN